LLLEVVWAYARLATQAGHLADARAPRAAGRSLHEIEIPGASHAITVSQPEATVQLILEAATLHVAA